MIKNREGRGASTPLPGLSCRGETVTTKDLVIDKNVAQLPMSGAIVIRGAYSDVARVLKEVENNLPQGCKIAYVHYSPYRLIITEEGRR